MFTGERVIPGEVESDLWNEHVARYHFASLFAAGKRVLDVGCGTGYGTALLAESASEASGFDISNEAIAYARAHYPKARFAEAAAHSFPPSTASVDLVTAFEVIEHVPDWQDLIEEAHRVLTPDGVFLVSTPNQIYYSESRKEAGPNPFHVHEFEYAGFEEALGATFPFVRILAQNQQECIVFAGGQAAERGLCFAPGTPDMLTAQFFMAVCAKRPVEIPSFTYVASAANMLREREHYIHSLDSELNEARAQHGTLLAEHRRLEDELNRQNAWAASEHARLEAELKDRNQWAAAEQARLEAELNKQNAWALSLDRELDSARAKLDELHSDLEERTAWARRLESELAGAHVELAAAHAEVGALRDQLGAARAEAGALRDQLAARDARIRRLIHERDLVRQSRWVRLGRKLNMGPDLAHEPE